MGRKGEGGAMSDLGDLIIKERPLIIREAIAGGRRLTKALFMQLPQEDHLITEVSEDTQIRAWVNLHWKGCDADFGEGSGSFLYEHRHIIYTDQGRPMRGEAWKPYSPDSSIYVETRGGVHALAALLARAKLKGAKVDGRYLIRDGYGTYTVKTKFDQQPLTLELFNPLASDLQTYMGDGEEPPKPLVVLAAAHIPREDLIAAVQTEIDSERTFREDLAAIWKLVTEETPQVFL